MRIAITGASGLIGRRLISVLGGDGHAMLSMVRRPPRSRTEIGWDPDSGLTTPDRMEEVDALIHLAGENLAAGRWTAARKRAFRSSRVQATRCLVESLQVFSHPPKRVLCASAIGYYGNHPDRVFTETDPPGEGFLAELTRDWEEASAPLESMDVRRVCLRTGMVLSRNGGALAKMLPIFRLGLGGVLGSGRQAVSWIHIDDLADAVALILARPDIVGPVNLVSPSPVTHREFTKTLGRVIHRPTVLPAPAWALRLVLGEMADAMVLQGARVRPAVLDSAGYPFRFANLQPALRDLLG